MTVEIAKVASSELEEAFCRLIPQLSRSASAMHAEQIAQLLDQDAIDLLIFRGSDDKILGMLTLVTFTIPTGVRAWIEDVVVDGDARGQGAGRKLVEAAVELAQSRGAKTVDLTSRPSRQAANRLYQRCGFAARETNVYRFAAEN